MLVTVAGTLNADMPVLENDRSPIVVNVDLPAIVTLTREVQPAKAPTPILTTEAGIDTEIRPEQHDTKALSSISVASSDIIALPAVSTRSLHSFGAGKGEATGAETGSRRNVGCPVGCTVGCPVGFAEGFAVGCPVGFDEGFDEGCPEG